jgi:aspartyl-tRNA(Asn)/glutamyl-tRNA(Gln) amidotransferase subunit C
MAGSLAREQRDSIVSNPAGQGGWRFHCRKRPERPGLHGTIRSVSAPLTIADVERIAALAHLELTEEEKRVFTKQLADILAYAEQLQEIDTTGVAATAHVNAHEAERDDDPKPSLPVEEALRNAPDGVPDAGLFRVPRVIA